jgi:protein ImuA
MSALAPLRARLAALAGIGPQSIEGTITFGVPALDGALPWGGLKRAGLYEVEGDPGPALGFCLALAQRAADPRGLVLWCATRRQDSERGALYGPGLGAFGLAPSRLLLVRARNGREALWTLEEGLRCRSVSVAIGAVDEVPMVASRRLQLAAESNGATAFLLLDARPARAPSAAFARWRVAAAPGPPASDGPVKRVRPGIWRLELARCRGGAGGVWHVEWNDETHSFALAAAASDRSRALAPSGAADESLGDDRDAGRTRLRARG